MARAPPHSAVVQVRPCWVPRHALFPRGCVRTISMKKSARIEMNAYGHFDLRKRRELAPIAVEIVETSVTRHAQAAIGQTLARLWFAHTRIARLAVVIGLTKNG